MEEPYKPPSIRERGIVLVYAHWYDKPLMPPLKITGVDQDGIEQIFKVREVKQNANES